MTKKITKKEMFGEVIALAEGRVLTKATLQEVVEFAQHEIDLLENKRSKSGQTKTQKENEVLVEQLFDALSDMDKPVTITEFQNQSATEVATLSNQKLSALLGKLIDAGRVVKTTEKRKSYFAVVRE